MANGTTQSVVDKIYVGPAEVIWGIDDQGEPEQDAVVIDLTQNGVNFRTETTYFEPTTDQTGSAPVASIITGMIGYLEMQTPDMDFDKVTFFNPNATKVVDGTDPDKVKYQVTGLAGKILPRRRALIKPFGIEDPNRYIYLEACSIKFDAQANYVNDDNQRLQINGVAYPDLDATPRGLVFTWGDWQAGLSQQGGGTEGD